MFDGTLRATVIYRNQWADAMVPFATYGVSADKPITLSKRSDYIGIGLQVFRDQAGDGNLINFTGSISTAYHRPFGKSKKPFSSKEFSIGIQGGYFQRSTNLSDIYFNTALPPMYSSYNPFYTLGIGNNISDYTFNAGASYSQSVNSCFNFTIGLSANNINQPVDAIEKIQQKHLGIDRNYTAVLGANWTISKRLTLRPAMLYVARGDGNDIIFGNEFCYAVTTRDLHHYPPTSVFIAVWYRSADIMTIAAGLKYKRLNIGFGFDQPVSSPSYSGSGGRGIELSLKYITPKLRPIGIRRPVPCNRF